MENSDNKKNADSDELFTMLLGRIKKNLKRMKGWLKQNDISCYRLYNRDIPQLPFAIDIYNKRLHCSVFLEDKDSLTDDDVKFFIHKVADELKIDRNNIFIKSRSHSKGGEQYGVLNRDNDNFEVTEGGLKFIVNLSDRLDTGLFLDHRITRKLVKKESNNKMVLNLFAYTGSFSVYAASGGAKTTVTMDLSNSYLDTAKKNMEINGFTGFNHKFVKQDVLSYLKDYSSRDKYDLIILDPPTVSTSKSMEKKLVIQDDHKWMIESALKMLRSKGVLYFSTNYRKFKLSDKIAASKIEEITSKTVPMDFALHRPHKCYRIEK
ncbi:MAG: class I SAM-dependent methyltransferase [Deltaproteobacteria bacterium]|nr:class I SAM-dependent methyltransferase [Deltaproteobacteria bacterium]